MGISMDKSFDAKSGCTVYTTTSSKTKRRSVSTEVTSTYVDADGKAVKSEYHKQKVGRNKIVDVSYTKYGNAAVADGKKDEYKRTKLTFKGETETVLNTSFDGTRNCVTNRTSFETPETKPKGTYERMKALEELQEQVRAQKELEQQMKREMNPKLSPEMLKSDFS